MSLQRCQRDAIVVWVVVEHELIGEGGDLLLLNLIVGVLLLVLLPVGPGGRRLAVCKLRRSPSEIDVRLVLTMLTSMSGILGGPGLIGERWLSEEEWYCSVSESWPTKWTLRMVLRGWVGKDVARGGCSRQQQPVRRYRNAELPTTKVPGWHAPCRLGHGRRKSRLGRGLELASPHVEQQGPAGATLEKLLERVCRGATV